MTEIESVQELTRTEIADYLRAFATQLDTSPPGTGTQPPEGEDDHRVTLLVGEDSATIDPPERITFEVEVETEEALMGNTVEHEIEFELSWQTEPTDEADEKELDIV